MTGATKATSLFVMQTRIIVPEGDKNCDGSMENSSVETMVTEEPEGPPDRKVKIWCHYTGQLVEIFLLFDYRSTLGFYTEGPTVIGIVSWGIHVIGATGILIITLRRRGRHGLWLDYSNEIGVSKLLVQLRQWFW